jgi:hypothetical protein
MAEDRAQIIQGTEMGANEKRTIDGLFADSALMEKVLQRAVQEALLRHKQAGDPVAVWRDGRVVWIPPEEIPEPLSEPRPSGSRGAAS